MSRWWLPLTLGLMAFGFGLVVFAPAATLHGWLYPAQAPVSLRGVSGTLPAGRVGAVLQQGQVRAENVEWRLKPWSLLGLTPRVQLQGRALGAPFAGEVSASPTGRLGVHGLQASGDIKTVLTAFQQGFLPVDGLWRLEMDELQLKDEWPQTVDGRLTLQGLRWTLMRDPLVIGDFEALLSTEPGPQGAPPTLLATVRSLEGAALQVEGTARQFADRRQLAELRLKPAPGAPPLIANLLNGLGAPDTEGWYRLRREGRLP